MGDDRLRSREVQDDSMYVIELLLLLHLSPFLSAGTAVAEGGLYVS